MRTTSGGKTATVRYIHSQMRNGSELGFRLELVGLNLIYQDGKQIFFSFNQDSPGFIIFSGIRCFRIHWSPLGPKQINQDLKANHCVTKMLVHGIFQLILSF